MHSRISAAAAAVVLSVCAVASNAPPPPRLRLNQPVKPLHYAAELTIVPNQDTFRGAIDIDVDFAQPQKLLWLNAHNLTVSKAFIAGAGSQSSAAVVRGDDQVIGFDFGRPVSGRATLHVDYTGKINRKVSDGIFQLEQGGDWYVYTQFESTSARQAFPCFDEPSYKTPWQITLRVPKQLAAFDNYPQVSESPASGNMKLVKFAETRPLPSYLVAFAVGPFETVDAGKLGNAQLRIVVPRGRTGDAKFAVESIPQQLALLERYFGMPYPYPKLDSISMRMGGFAMENPGLITYDESLLLSNAASDTIGRQRVAAEVTAHEMAHLWFGDLVTTAWWDDTWLNEAFATWMERRILGDWKPEWKIDVTAADEREKAMALDSLVSARRIRQPIESYNDIANAFDNITYEKGAAVIAMFESWVGPDKFREGVRSYMRRHADGNATAADFTAAISSAAGKDIAPAFNTFLDQPGVPVISVSLDGDGLRLSQKRSLPIGAPPSTPETWQVPVCMRIAGGRQQCFLLTDSTAHVPTSAAPEWVVGNAAEKGYYRVQYSPELLAKLTADHGALLSEPERVGLVADTEAEMNSGLVSPKVALGMVPVFAGDPDRHVVDIAFNIAATLESNIVPVSLEPKAEQFIRDNFGRRAEELGWQPGSGDGPEDRLLRETLVPRVAGEGRDRKLIDQASELARKWLDDHSAVDPGISGAVLRVAAEFGDRNFFERLHAAALSEKNQRYRDQMILALGSFRDPAISRSAMKILLTDEFDPRESEALFRAPLDFPETRELPFEFVRRNYDALTRRMSSAAGLDAAAGLPQLGTGFCDAEHRHEVEKFFTPRMASHPGGPRILAQTIERMNICIAQKQSLGSELTAFLTAYGG